MINTLNINIINSKLFIGKASQYDYDIFSMVKINDNSKSLYTKYTYNNNHLLFEFKINQFCNLIKMVIELVQSNKKFNIGCDLYRNLFYLLIDFNFNFNFNFNDHIDIEYKLTNNSFDNKLIEDGGYGKIYEYLDDVIKINYFNIALNEIINYFKLIYNVKKLNLSLNIAKFKKIVLYHNKKYSIFSHDIIKQKFFIGIIMEKYYPILNVNQSILIKLVNNIMLLNNSKIYLPDLKHKNVMWDNINNDLVLIDFDSVCVNDLNEDNYISSGYNTSLFYWDVSFEKNDICGLVDIVLTCNNINICDLLIHIIDNTFQYNNDEKINTIKKIRLQFKNQICDDQIIKIVYHYFNNKKFKFNKYQLLLIIKYMYGLVTFDDILLFIKKVFSNI